MPRIPGELPTSPLERVSSLKVKLGLLVSVSVLVATVLATLGADTVPAWLSIPVTVLLALGVTQLLAIGMTSPLREMTAGARRMAAGDHAVRVHATSNDEVGELARAFNAMAGDLATVDRQRRELVATVSHELRTPLTALVAVLDNLADGVTPPDARTISTALEQAHRLSDLVADLLDLSRVDAGVVPLRRTEVSVARLVDAAMSEAGTAARAASRSVTLEHQVEPVDLTTYVDPDRLHQVLANLLDNACRHSPPGGVVGLVAEAAGSGVRIEVSDQGPGIDPQDRERVFERFGTAGGGGTGLGLAIARWITDLHGGRIEVMEPSDAAPGAHVRIELPGRDLQPGHAVPHTPTLRRSPLMTNPASVSEAPTAVRTEPPRNVTDELFGGWWRDAAPARPGVLLTCLAIGLLAAVALPFASIGLGASLVLLAAGALVLTLSPRRREPYVVASAVTCAGLAVVLTMRDAVWIGTLGLLAAAVLVPVALGGAHAVRGMVVSCLAWPLAGVRGIPWLGRCLRALTGTGNAIALLRTAVLSLGAALVFGLLFASADAVFGQWIGRLLPELGDRLVLRVFTGVAVAGVVLAAAYLALNSPTPPAAHRRQPARRRYEWLAPVLLVDLVFVAFLAAQATAFVGGHDFVQRTTGLTYAEYVHQGFGQLTVATALTLVVVALAARKADVQSVADRRWLRLATGLLCLLTLLVVASALQRMALYTDAYGLTRLRLVVALFEGWLGLVLLGVLVAGIRLRASWLPRAAVLSGAVALLGLALANPDALIARVNVDRYEETGRIDWSYLSDLSADAVPTLAGLPATEQRCAMPDGRTDSAYDDGWSAWNLGRARAAELRPVVDPQESLPVCP